MSDVYMLFTPILVLVVIALLGFIGCGRVGFDPLPAPRGLTAIGRCGWVELNWESVANSPNYDLARVVAGYEHLIYHGNATTFNDVWILDTPAWSPPSYKVRTIFSPTYLSDYSAAVTPTSMPQALVTMPATVLNPRINYTGYVGMEIQTNEPLSVCAIGRFVFSSDGVNSNPVNTSHLLRIIDAVRDTVVGEAEVSTIRGSNSIFDPNDSFVYATLPTPVEIMPDSVNQGRFYIVSQERDMTGSPNPESWCDGDTLVTCTPDVTVIGSVAGDIGGWVRQKTGSFSFGPVNLLYQVSAI